MGIFKDLLIKAENGDRNAIETIVDHAMKKGDRVTYFKWVRKISEPNWDEFGEWCSEQEVDPAEYEDERMEEMCRQAEEDSDNYDDFVNDDKWR